ncbi:hypothetical protein BP6252_00825 [Coleophoma cylindrospora]|uniref:Uncharacterized protein n=1 Tax=Coleophoma cylindrospora TaxID=1849047 RepID=A0A3D8SR54_9HELO|nr:hypothetical protein BP6252_00825 [Coleophoma cylindrospora]
MVQVSILLAFAAGVSAVPLNINLGAYSPALVVGDGEISFGGKADVTGLMNALEGAAVSGAAAKAAGAPAAAAPAAASAAPAAASVAPAATTQDTQITALQGMGKEIAPRIVQLTKSEKAAKRDLSGFDRALQYAAAALRTSPEVQLGTGEGGSGVGITQKAGGVTSGTKAAKRTEPFTYDAEGNEIEKRTEPFTYDAEGNEVEKRTEPFTYDAEGNEVEKRTEPFTYDAEGNEIEKRSTGEAFQYGDEKRSEKRTEMKTTVTTMYIRGGVSAGVPQGAVTKRSSSMQRRAPSAGIDGVNLNVNDGQGLTLTFVETKAADEED